MSDRQLNSMMYSKSITYNADSNRTSIRTVELFTKIDAKGIHHLTTGDLDYKETMCCICGKVKY